MYVCYWGSSVLYRINRTGTGAIVDCVISVGLVLGYMCRISRINTWTAVKCVVSIGLVQRQCSGLYHISRTGTGTIANVSYHSEFYWGKSGLCCMSRTGTRAVVDCFISVGLVLGR